MSNTAKALDFLNKATTLSPEQRAKMEDVKKYASEQLAKAKASAAARAKIGFAWLKISSNRTMLLGAILLFMIFLNFAVFMSVNFDDLDKSGEEGDNARSKVGHLKNISIASFVFFLLFVANIVAARVMKPTEMNMEIEI